MKTIKVDSLEQLLKTKELQIVDVREIEEYSEGHIKGSILVSMSNFVGMMSKINKDLDVYVICRTDKRSKIAAEFLLEKGYSVIQVLGGISTYKGKLVKS